MIIMVLGLHAAIVAAREAGRTVRARELMLDPIGHVEQALGAQEAASPAAHERRRATLAPVALSHRAR